MESLLQVAPGVLITLTAIHAMFLAGRRLLKGPRLSQNISTVRETMEEKLSLTAGERAILEHPRKDNGILTFVILEMIQVARNTPLDLPNRKDEWYQRLSMKNAPRMHRATLYSGAFIFVAELITRTSSPSVMTHAVLFYWTFWFIYELGDWILSARADIREFHKTFKVINGIIGS